MVILLIREVQDLFDVFKKLILASFVGYLWYSVWERYGIEVIGAVTISFFVLLVFYIMERFEEILEDNDRLRVTQLSWIAETGGDENAESSDYE